MGQPLLEPLGFDVAALVEIVTQVSLRFRGMA